MIQINLNGVRTRRKKNCVKDTPKRLAVIFKEIEMGRVGFWSFHSLNFRRFVCLDDFKRCLKMPIKWKYANKVDRRVFGKHLLNDILGHLYATFIDPRSK